MMYIRTDEMLPFGHCSSSSADMADKYWYNIITPYTKRRSQCPSDKYSTVVTVELPATLPRAYGGAMSMADIRPGGALALCDNNAYWVVYCPTHYPNWSDGFAAFPIATMAARTWCSGMAMSSGCARAICCATTIRARSCGATRTPRLV